MVPHPIPPLEGEMPDRAEGGGPKSGGIVFDAHFLQ
jgi:hypothetical protein